MMSILKNILVAVGLLLIAGLGFYLYTNNSLFLAGDTEQNFQIEAQSEDFVRRLGQLKRISIDQSLFSDQRFTVLQSFASPVPALPVGRTNPFSDRL